MREGRDFEDYVAKRFCEIHDKKVRKSGYSYQSKEHPFMLANVDRWVIGENAGLECKTAGPMNKTKWEDGNIPESYYAQCMHYMAVTGADRWYIAILVFQEDVYTFCIERNEDDIRTLIEKEAEFWRMVEEKEMPPMDGTVSSSDALEAIYVPEEGSQISLLDTADFAKELLEKKRQIKELQDRVKYLENNIKLEMEENEKADTDFCSISWKPQISNRVDTKLLKKEFPDVYEYCLKPSESRPFKITEKKEKEKK
jgi:predicted phage-related endonuclease